MGKDLKLPMFWRLFWVIMVIFASKTSGIPTCRPNHEIVEGELVSTLSFIIPKNKVETEIRIKTQLYFTKAVKNDDDLPDVSIKSLSQVLRDVAESRPVTFMFKYNTLKNLPEIGQISINNRNFCKNETILGSESSQLKTVEKTFELQLLTDRRPPFLGLELSDYSDENCGNVRIVNAFSSNFERKDYKRLPWVTAVYANEEYVCTGNFISRTRAVTAAHCLKRRLKPKDVFLKFLNDEVIEILSFERHPSYDLAILNTAPITEDGFVPVCLTDTDSLEIGSKGSVLTFGPNDEDTSDQDEELKGAQFEVISSEKCHRQGNDMPKYSFCVGKSEQNAGLCHGDSGAGFMTFHAKRYFLRGVASAVNSENEKCSIDSNVIFTDLTKFLTFITK